MENKIEPCPKCESENTVKNGFVILSGGITKQRFKCMECGHIWREE